MQQIGEEMVWITVDGCDNSGKTTLISNINSKIQNCMVSKEPGNSKLSTCIKIREAIFDPTTNEKAAIMLFLADRAQNIQEFIMPNIENNIILQDRGSLSTIAYYLAAREEEWDFKELTKELLVEMLSYVQPIRPDIGFITSADEGFLYKKPTDRIEERGIEFQKKVSKYLLSICDTNNYYGYYFSQQKFFPKRIVILPTIPAATQQQVAEVAIDQINSL